MIVLPQSLENRRIGAQYQRGRPVFSRTGFAGRPDVELLMGIWLSFVGWLSKD